MPWQEFKRESQTLPLKGHDCKSLQKVPSHIKLANCSLWQPSNEGFLPDAFIKWIRIMSPLLNAGLAWPTFQWALLRNSSKQLMSAWSKSKRHREMKVLETSIKHWVQSCFLMLLMTSLNPLPDLPFSIWCPILHYLFPLVNFTPYQKHSLSPF